MRKPVLTMILSVAGAAGRCHPCHESDTEDVATNGTMKGLLSGQTWAGTLKLTPMAADLLQAP